MENYPMPVPNLIEAYQRIAEAKAQNAEILNLSGLFLQEIPAEVFEMTQLKELYLFFNNLKEIPEEIGNLTQLVDLHFTCNFIEGVPAVVFSLPNLQRFSVAQNPVKIVSTELKNASDAIFLISVIQKDSSLIFANYSIACQFLRGIPIVELGYSEDYERKIRITDFYKDSSAGIENIPQAILKEGTLAMKQYLSQHS